jgi:hypothetical protein
MDRDLCGAWFLDAELEWVEPRIGGQQWGCEQKEIIQAGQEA